MLLAALVLLSSRSDAQARGGSTGGTEKAAKSFVVPEWVFLYVAPAPNPPAPDSVVHLHLPDALMTYTQRQVLNAFEPVDWFPDLHPPTPASAARGTRPSGRACVFCHLYNGNGRPENAMIAGLPADYIVRQVRAFRDGTRLMAMPGVPRNGMHPVAAGVPESTVVAAAAYFAALPVTRRSRIVEAARIPRVRKAGLLYAYAGPGTEAIAGRLIEVPEDLERHEWHDPTVGYVAYVPPGAIRRGRALATSGPEGLATACASCHGAGLRGSPIAPRIAGQFPTVILRQLVNFRTGARADSAAAAMRPVVKNLSVDQMVALAAYVGSLPPSSAARR